MKLDSPEGRSLVRLINTTDPAMLIDLHTTNGSKHRYQLTYDVPHNPASPEKLRSFMRKQMMPAVTSQLKKQGTNTYYYGNFNRTHSSWTTYGHQPRYSTEYMGLRGRLGILSEAYSYIPYKDRVKASRAFVTACLDFANGNSQAIKSLIRQVDAARVPQIGLQSKLAKFDKKVVVNGYETKKGQTNQPKDYAVDFFGRYESTHSVKMPTAYLLPFQLSRVADRLRMHGIKIDQLKQDTKLKVEEYVLQEKKSAARAFQGHRLVTAKTQTKQREAVIPVGTYVIRTAQPLGRLAAYLLEPSADDSLLTWNFFDDSSATGKPFPVQRVLDPLTAPLRPVSIIKPAEQLNLDKVYGPRGRVNFGGAFSLGTKWVKGTQSYTVSQSGRTYLVDAAGGAMTPQPTLRLEKFSAAFSKLKGVKSREAQQMARQGTWNKDKTFRMVNFKGDLYIYDATSDQAFAATKTAPPEQLAVFSPDGQRIAFVREYNLFVYDLKQRKEIALSSEGHKKLLHGRLDWVYQEELYGRGNFRGFWWSPNSTHIAYLRLDESPVRSYTVADNIPYRQSLEVTSYPKSGDPIPKVALGIANCQNAKTTWINLEEYSKADFLIPRVGWTAEGKHVIYQVQDRAQTWLDLRLAASADGATTKLFRETTKAWVSAPRDPVWLKDNSFLWLSERSGNQHVYRVSPDGKQVTQITSGDWEVSRILGLDPDQKTLYFIGTADGAVAQNAYRVALQGGKPQRLTRRRGNHSVRFSEDFHYFIDYCSTVHSPIQARLYRNNGSFVRTLDPNLDDRLKYLNVKPPELVKVRARDGHVLDGMLIKPANYSPQKKYPVLIYVYSGPQAPVVRDRWSGSTYLWHQMLAQQGYCIWMCDNRSATHRGAKYAWPIHKSMGKQELADIEDGIGWLVNKGIADPKRIGIWGWSYGGYMTSYALTHSKLFKMGIAGAPVTDWRNYDAVYTERYMGLPQSNKKGYQESSVVAAAKSLHGRLLLIHGTKDDNVHIGNTMQLANALQNAGKRFDLMIYPKNRHSIAQPRQARHLRELMTRFIHDNL